MSDQVKFCVDCQWCAVDEQSPQFSRCGRPGLNNPYFLTTGMTSQHGEFCSVERRWDCGPQAIYFVQRVEPLTKLPWYKRIF